MRPATQPRPAFGDGHTPTSQIEPARCPTCREQLMITCPNACESAADGAGGYMHPVATLPAPKTRGPKLHRELKVGAEGTGTRGRILAWLHVAESPMTTPELAAKLEAPTSRVSVMLGLMVRAGEVRRVARGQYEAA